MSRPPLPFEVARARAARATRMRAALSGTEEEDAWPHRRPRRPRLPLLWVVIITAAFFLLQLRQAPAQESAILDQIAAIEAKAKGGNAMAQYEYGTLAYTGLGLVQDYTGAAAWLEKSAKQGNAEAQCELGFLYQTGSFGQGPPPPDPKRAALWYEMAAKQNDACGAFALAALYRRGTGVEKNPFLAATFMGIATAGGFEPKPHVLPLQQLQNHFYAVAYQLTGGLAQWRDLVSASAGGGG